MVPGVILVGIFAAKDFPFGSVNSCKKVLGGPGPAGGHHLITAVFLRGLTGLGGSPACVSLQHFSFCALVRQAALHVAPIICTTLSWLVLLGGWQGLGLYHGDIGFHCDGGFRSCSACLQNRAAGVWLMRAGRGPLAVHGALLSPAGAGGGSEGSAHVLHRLRGAISLRRWHHQEQFGLLGNGGWLPAGRRVCEGGGPGARLRLCLAGCRARSSVAATRRATPLCCSVMVTLTGALGRRRKRARQGGRLAFALHFIYAISGFQNGRWL